MKRPTHPTARAPRGRAPLAIAVALALSGGTAAAQPASRSDSARPRSTPARRPIADAARVHLERGLAAYRAHAYRRAADEFRAGHEIDAHPDFLFPWAQAERLAGDCRAAVALYRQVLATALPPAEELQIRRLQARCEAEMARTARPLKQAASGRDLARDRPRPRPWYLDPWGGLLAGGGVVAVGVGAGFLASGRAANRAAAGHPDTLDDFDTLTDRARDRGRIGAIALGVGGALLAGAAVRYVLSAGEAPPGRAESVAGPWLDRSGDALAFGAALTGRF